MSRVKSSLHKCCHPERAPPCYTASVLLRHLDLIEQIGMAIQHFEQLNQGQGCLGFAILVAREGIDAAAEDFGCLALVKRQLLAHLDDESRVNGGPRVFRSSRRERMKIAQGKRSAALG